MTRLVLTFVVIVVAAIAGATFGWKYVLAPLLGWAFFRWAFASLQSMAAGGVPAAQAGDNTPRPATTTRERTLYWCEECGTELLLVMRGSGVIPRHCGTRMHERTELLGGGGGGGADSDEAGLGGARFNEVADAPAGEQLPWDA